MTLTTMYKSRDSSSSPTHRNHRAHTIKNNRGPFLINNNHALQPPKDLPRRHARSQRPHRRRPARQHLPHSARGSRPFTRHESLRDDDLHDVPTDGFPRLLHVAEHRDEHLLCVECSFFLLSSLQSTSGQETCGECDVACAFV